MDVIKYGTYIEESRNSVLRFSCFAVTDSRHYHCDQTQCRPPELNSRQTAAADPSVLTAVSMMAAAAAALTEEDPLKRRCCFDAIPPESDRQAYWTFPLPAHDYPCSDSSALITVLNLRESIPTVIFDVSFSRVLSVILRHHDLVPIEIRKPSQFRFC